MFRETRVLRESPSTGETAGAVKEGVLGSLKRASRSGTPREMGPCRKRWKVVLAHPRSWNEGLSPSDGVQETSLRVWG